MTGKGRIYRVFDAEVLKQPIRLETKKLLAEGMEERKSKELATLLAHQDMRVRQAAQFALADKGDRAIKTLVTVARKDANQLARLHAIWRLGQISSRFQTTGARSEVTAALESLVALFADADAEVRTQAAKVLGEQGFLESYDGLIKLLGDSSPRVRFFAATAVGKLARREAIPSLFGMLRENADRDPYLRHAGALALARIKDVDALLAAVKNESRSVRIGVVLALRRLERSEIAAFLSDFDLGVVLEAARAINDVPISGAMPEPAALIDKQIDSEPLLHRVINANYRCGTVIVRLKNGSAYVGVLKSENENAVVINAPEDGIVTVKKSDIQARDKGLSGMPEDLDVILSKQDLRNLLEYLSGLK